MAQYDVVAARTSAFADLLKGLNSALEPSQAEKEASKLTSDLRRMQMMHQMQKSITEGEQVQANAELDSQYATGLNNLTAYSEAVRPQQRFGMRMLGYANGPLDKGTAPGEQTRAFLNPSRWIKGSHNMNPVLAGVVATGLVLGTYVGATTVATTGIIRFLGSNAIRRMVAPKMLTRGAMGRPVVSEAFKNSTYIKSLDILGKTNATARRHGAFILKHGTGTFAKTAGAIGLGIEGTRRTVGLIDGDPETGFIFNPPSVYDKNPYALSPNSYFEPSVIMNVSDDINNPGGYREAFSKIKFNHEQGVPMEVSARMLARNIQDIALMYPSSMNADNPSIGDYISHELYNNLKLDEIVYVNDKPVPVRNLINTFENDKLEIGNMYNWLHNNGYIK